MGRDYLARILVVAGLAIGVIAIALAVDGRAIATEVYDQVRPDTTIGGVGPLFVAHEGSLIHIGVPGRDDVHQALDVRLEETGNATIRLMGNDSIIELRSAAGPDDGARVLVAHRRASVEIGVGEDGVGYIVAKDSFGKVIWKHPE